jgi:hypothetical protein
MSLNLIKTYFVYSYDDFGVGVSGIISKFGPTEFAKLLVNV